MIWTATALAVGICAVAVWMHADVEATQRQSTIGTWDGPPLWPRGPTDPSRADVATSARAVQQREVCGFGPVTLKSDADAIESLPRARLDEVRRIATAAFRSSADPRVQAGHAFIDHRIEDLVSQAHASQDPAIYFLARGACLRSDATAVAPAITAACATLDAAGLTAREPANAQAWLQAAQDAAARNDDAVVEVAMLRASQSQYSEPHLMTVWTAMVAALPADPPLVRTVMVPWLTMVGTSQPVELLSAYRSCNDEALANPVRHGSCSALAEVLATRSRTPLESKVGIGIGARVGWPQERVDRLTEERDQWIWIALLLQHQRESAPGGVYGCESTEMLLRWSEDMYRDGEEGAMRRAVERSGRPLSEWAAEAAAHRRAFLAPATAR